MTLPLLAGLLEEPEARLVAILTTGYAGDGGATALRRLIPSGYFRASARYRGVEGAASLIDPSYNVSEFDRAVAIEWDTVESEREQNERDPSEMDVFRFRVTVGYLTGKGHTRHAHVTSPETQAAAVAFAQRRAIEDAGVIRLALCCPELYAGDTTPMISDVAREGAAAIESLGAGRLLCTTSFRIRIDVAR